MKGKGFQYALIGIFLVAGVVAIVLFANPPEKDTNTSDGSVVQKGTVTIWGTFPASGMRTVLDAFNTKYQDYYVVNYVFHDPKTFDTDIVEALASPSIPDPDILLLPDDLMLRHSDKVDLIRMDARRFKETFIQAAEIYQREGGVNAIPFAVDPMVMFYNRDLFNNASLPLPPKNWEELLAFVPKLTKRDPKTSEVTVSAVAFGDYVNITHAKDVLAMLFLQVGNPIVAKSGPRYESKLTNFVNNQIVPDKNVVSALRFYMDFSDPRKSSTYTWNRSKKLSEDEFIDGKLAIYFGPSSDYFRISEKNPHLNFFVAPVPTSKTATAEITFAKVYGLSVMKTSPNRGTALQVVPLLLENFFAGAFAKTYSLPPVRLELLAERPSDAAMSVFYDAALRARTWADPRPIETDRAFQTMIESISSGRKLQDAALESLSAELNNLLGPYED